jgi:aromatic-amino-acid transaminase
VTSYLIPESMERPGDAIWGLNAEAARRAASGESILNLTAGSLLRDDGRLAVMPTVFAALAAVPAERAAAYAPIAGEQSFLNAVIRDLFGTGALAERAVAVATPGATGALHHAIINFLEAGQALLTTSYYWGPYATIAYGARRRVETFPMFNSENRFDVLAFDRALQRLAQQQGRVLIILNTPCHNPSGYSLNAEEWEQVVRAIRRVAGTATVSLAIDLAYAQFGPGDPHDFVPHVEALAEVALVLVAWTASKTYALYGARVGALVAVHPDPAERARIRSALAYSCRGTWSNCNHLGMLAVSKLLEEDGLRRCVDEERAELRRLLTERVAAFNVAASQAGLHYPRYEGGFFVTVFTPDAEATASRMRELGVYVVPLAGGVRVALCSTPAGQVPRLVDALVEGLRAAGSQP